MKRSGSLIPILVAAVVSTMAMSLSFVGSYAGLVASISNTKNTAGTGYLQMTENGTAATCKSTGLDSAPDLSTNYYLCGDVNKYGGTTTFVTGTPPAVSTKLFLPGEQRVAESVTITNTGNVPASSLTMKADDCTPSALPGMGAPPGANVLGTGKNTGICSKMQVIIKAAKITNPQGSLVTIYPVNTASAFAGTSINILSALGLTALAPGEAISFTILLRLNVTASPPDETYAGGVISQPITWTFGS